MAGAVFFASYYSFAFATTRGSAAVASAVGSWFLGLVLTLGLLRPAQKYAAVHLALAAAPSPQQQAASEDSSASLLGEARENWGCGCPRWQCPAPAPRCTPRTPPHWSTPALPWRPCPRSALPGQQGPPPPPICALPWWS
jgi:hypothetical protein